MPFDVIRRVVTGLNHQQKSVIVSDGPAPHRVQRPAGSVITELWRTDQVPTSPLGAPAEDDSGRVSLGPPDHGVSVRVAVFPPEQPDTTGALPSPTPAGTPRGQDHQPVPGMHQTRTVDVVTVVSGEITLQMEQGSTVLRTGDTVIQRGSMHAWRNTSGQPCTVVSTMIVADEHSHLLAASEHIAKEHSS